jgi:hypothetical protein
MSEIIASSSVYDSDTYYLLNSSYPQITQSFITPSSKYFLNKIEFACKKIGSPTGNMYVKLYSHSGTYGSSSLPTGDALESSTVIDVSTISTSENDKESIFSGTYELLSDTYYVISLEYSGGNLENNIRIFTNSFDGYYSGNMAVYNGSTWSFPNFGGESLDFSFYVYGTPSSPTISNISQISGIQSITF